MDITGFKRIIERDLPGWTIDETPQDIGEFLIRIKPIDGRVLSKVAVIVDGKVIAIQG